MLKWIRRLKVIIPIVIVLALIVGAFIVLGIVCRDEEVFIKEGWQKVTTKKTSGPPATWMPWYKPTRADKILKDWPAGTKIIEIEPHEETIHIAIPPSGDVLIPEGEQGITVFEKPKRTWGPEARPWFGGGYVDGIAAAGGLDIFKVKIIKDIHVGPALAYNGELSGGGSVGVNLWRNIDLRGYVGAQFSGGIVYGGAVAIGIQ